VARWSCADCHFASFFPIVYFMIGVLFNNTASRSQDRASGAAATRQQVLGH
jgi:hypothetical protein